MMNVIKKLDIYCIKAHELDFDQNGEKLCQNVLALQEVHKSKFFSNLKG